MTREYETPIDFKWVLVNFRGLQLSVKLAMAEARGGYSLEIVDFICPKHPEIDWKWIDRNRIELLNSLELGD